MRNLFSVTKAITMGIAIGLLCGAPAIAVEEGTEAAEAAASKGPIENIIITAQKRESDLQKTPVSVSAFNETQVDKFQISNPKDLTAFTPNLRAVPGSDGNNLVISSRGVAFGDSGLISTNHGTGIYIDGVYQAFTMASQMDVLDLERVEVLRGPQGTLYGRNTTGGAVRFISKKPSGDWGGKFSVVTGSYRQRDFRVFMDFPLLNGSGLQTAEGLGVLSGSASITSIARDPFYGNDCRNTDVVVLTPPSVCTGPARAGDESNRFGGRAVLNWDIRDHFNIHYSYDGHSTKEVGPDEQMVFLEEERFPGPAALYNGLSFGANGEGFGIDLRDFVNADRSKNLHTNASDQDEITIHGHTLNISYEFDDLGFLGDLEIKSITGHRHQEAEVYADRDGTPYQIYGQLDIVDQTQITQELNLIGNTEGDLGELDYVLGYFFFRHEATEDIMVDLFRDPGLFGIFGGGFPNDQSPELLNTAHAIFAHVGYRPPILDERLKFEFGFRSTWEDKFLEIFDALQLIRVSRDEDFSKVTPEGRISYQVTDDFMTYVSIAQGYNSGILNARATQEQYLEPAKEEVVLSYEFGVKFRGWNDRIQVNAAGFYMDYDDMQRTNLFIDPILTVPVSVITNAADARVGGLEIETLFAPVDSVLINANYGFTHSWFVKYIDCDLAADPNCGVLKDFADERRFSNVPEHSVNVGGEYRFHGFRFGVPSVRLDYYWQSETYVQDGSNERARSDSYGTLAVRAALSEVEAMGGMLEVAFFGRNITDESYREFGIDWASSSLGGIPWVTYGFGDPRTFGGELRLTF